MHGWPASDIHLPYDYLCGFLTVSILKKVLIAKALFPFLPSFYAIFMPFAGTPGSITQEYIISGKIIHTV
jgi:hypothetical protein